MDTILDPNGNSDDVSGPIGRFVRERRKARGWSQQDLADAAGVGRRLVVEIEAGKPSLRLDALQKVVHMFGKRIGLIDDVR